MYLFTCYLKGIAQKYLPLKKSYIYHVKDENLWSGDCDAIILGRSGPCTLLVRSLYLAKLYFKMHTTLLMA